LGQLFVALVDEETGEIIGGTDQKTLIIRKDIDSGGQVVEMRSCGIIYQELALIFQLVRGGLAPGPGKDSTVTAALHCVTSFVEALGSLAILYLPDLIVDMFRAKLIKFLLRDGQRVTKIENASVFQYTIMIEFD
jgi:hypothetical protein